LSPRLSFGEPGFGEPGFASRFATGGEPGFAPRNFPSPSDVLDNERSPRLTPSFDLLDLSEDNVTEVVRRIRLDRILGHGTCSSWEEVTPSDYEAAERVRTLIERGIVRIEGPATPAAILRALRAAESDFWSIGLS
jgi:hypothetical protein